MEEKKMVARKGNKRGELNEDSRKMVLLMLKYVCMRLEKVTMGKKKTEWLESEYLNNEKEQRDIGRERRQR